MYTCVYIYSTCPHIYIYSAYIVYVYRCTHATAHTCWYVRVHVFQLVRGCWASCNIRASDVLARLLARARARSRTRSTSTACTCRKRRTHCTDNQTFHGCSFVCPCIVYFHVRARTSVQIQNTYTYHIPQFAAGCAQA